MRTHNFYQSIKVPEQLEENMFDQKLNSIERIKPISKINLFVGSNNSGKSLILRNILKTKEFQNEIGQNIINQINFERNQFVQKIQDFLDEKPFNTLRNSSTIVLSQSILNNFNITYSHDSVRSYARELKEIFDISLGIMPFDKGITNGGMASFDRIGKDLKKEFYDIISPLRLWINELENKFSKDIDFNRIYCPTIRTLRKYDTPTLLENKTRIEYEFEDNIKIINGQKMYESILDMTQGAFEVREKKKAFESFLSLHFFDSQKVEIFSQPKIKELTIKIGDETERPIYSLGEGIQMILIITFPLFFYNNGIYVIEEPEIFLHPGLQHKLMNTLVSKEIQDDFIFLISTHSNHILDTINYQDELSVFSVTKHLPKGDSLAKNANFTVTNMAESKNDLLTLLGVRNTSVFLSNTTLWVEGVTDMLYLRKYFSVYLDSLKLSNPNSAYLKYTEGVHYSFILSAGSNIVHFDFSDEAYIKDLEEKVVVKNICGKSFVIVDSDNGKNSERKKKFFENLKGRFHVLKFKEIENSLSNETLIKAINEFSTCKNIIIPSANQKPHNFYKKKGIGNYIENNLMAGITKPSRKLFNTKPLNRNSTLNCKTEFCRHAIKHITYENTSNDIKDLIKEIFKFIEEHN